MTTAISSCRNHAIAPQRCLKSIPPSSGSVIEAIRRSFQTRSNVSWVPCFRRKLAYHNSGPIIRFTLQTRFLEIYMEKIPSFISCKLACHSKTWSAGSGRVSLCVQLLFFALEPFENPSGLALYKLAVFHRFSR